MNESLLYSFELNQQSDSSLPPLRFAIIRHNANKIQCYRSVKLIDREDSAISSFFFHPVSFFLFFLPFFFPVLRVRLARDRVILAYPRRRPANTRGGGAAMPRPNFRHSKTRAGYIGASVVLGKGLAFDLRAGSSALL